MSSDYDFDLIDGLKVSPLVIRTDQTLVGLHSGTVHVESGHLDLEGVLRGTLNVYPGASVFIKGVQQGSVILKSKSTAIVYGKIQGTTVIEPGALLTIEQGAILAGTLSNYGKLTLKGEFGGQINGNGEFNILDSGCIKTPKVIDGNYYYEW